MYYRSVSLVTYSSLQEVSFQLEVACGNPQRNILRHLYQKNIFKTNIHYDVIFTLSWDKLEFISTSYVEIKCGFISPFVINSVLTIIISSFETCNYCFYITFVYQ